MQIPKDADTELLRVQQLSSKDPNELLRVEGTCRRWSLVGVSS